MTSPWISQEHRMAHQHVHMVGHQHISMQLYLIAFQRLTQAVKVKTVIIFRKKTGFPVVTTLNDMSWHIRQIHPWTPGPQS
ncbi:MAG: hypothetical protein UX18_C0023G0024 [Candidatus Azambacteria bacterium GW2011_GWC2_45_7b]|uniref:Uncharacterized protein n=1 Tax=Candidatus Azambacteria bacterium GW2011_GWC2_45_7b TaxID=1618621 RepID=A0A837IJL8_9BACT|nr:MAG: hypothetical protein UX18_C0023G0024 [Candidatus Azambacteria bacterium GW2011_GWC2_45_7b]